MRRSVPGRIARLGRARGVARGGDAVRRGQGRHAVGRRAGRVLRGRVDGRPACEIDPIDAPQPDLRAGDQVARWTGGRWTPGPAPCSTRRSPGPPAARTRTRSSGPAASSRVTVAWAAPGARRDRSLEGWSVVVLSIGLAAIAGFVLARRPDEPAAAALVLVACGVAGSSVPWFLGTTPSDVALGGPFLLHALLTGVLYMVTWPAAVHLGLVFPSRRCRRRAPPVDRLAAVPGRVRRVRGSPSPPARLATPSTLEWIGTWPTDPARHRRAVHRGVARARGRTRFGRDRPTRSRGARSRWAAVRGCSRARSLGLVLFQMPELAAGAVARAGVAGSG